MAHGQPSILRFQFEDLFQNCCLSTHQGVIAQSAAIDGGGNRWRLLLRRGSPQSQLTTIQENDDGNLDDDEHDFISMVLMKDTLSRDLQYDGAAKFSFVVRDVDGNVRWESTFLSSQCGSANSRGPGSNMIMLNKVKVDEDILDSGSLIVDVEIQTLTSTTPNNTHCNPLRNIIIDLFESGSRADVAFNIHSSNGGGITLYAHKWILETSAPALARLCDGYDVNRPLCLFGISPDSFRHFLRWVYGGNLPSVAECLGLGKELIDLSYRFGQPSLKDEVERLLIQHEMVDTSNCIDYILFSIDNKCLALKTHAISYLTATPKDVLQLNCIEKLKPHPDLMHEIMLAMSANSKPRKGKLRLLPSWNRSKRKQRTPVTAEKKKDKKRAQVSPAHEQFYCMPAFEEAYRIKRSSPNDPDGKEVREEAMRLLEVAESSRQRQHQSQHSRTVDEGWPCDSDGFIGIVNVNK